MLEGTSYDTPPIDYEEVQGKGKIIVPLTDGMLWKGRTRTIFLILVRRGTPLGSFIA